MPASTPPASSAAPEAVPSAEPLKVVTAFYPLTYLAEQVGGDQITVTNLTPPGGEPHDLELTPQQVAAIGEADLVLYIEGFQPAVDEAVVFRLNCCRCGGCGGWQTVVFVVGQTER